MKKKKGVRNQLIAINEEDYLAIKQLAIDGETQIKTVVHNLLCEHLFLSRSSKGKTGEV